MANAVASTMIGCMCVGYRVGCCVSVGFFSLHVIDVNDIFVKMYPFPSPWGFFLGLESRFLRAAPLSSLSFILVFLFFCVCCFCLFLYFFVFVFWVLGWGLVGLLGVCKICVGCPLGFVLFFCGSLFVFWVLCYNFF